MHDQAEDRCHRIGQHDAVTAWYLLAAETIDETMVELIARKRGIVGAVTDGRRDESEALVAVRRARAARRHPRRRLRVKARERPSDELRRGREPLGRGCVSTFRIQGQPDTKRRTSPVAPKFSAPPPQFAVASCPALRGCERG